MLDLGTLSRPLRRILAEWVGNLVDRLLHFRNQLRFGFIELISSSVAETIEDTLHRPFTSWGHRHQLEEETWHPPYLANEHYSESYHDRPLQVIEPVAKKPSWYWERWLAVLVQAGETLLRWLKASWVESTLAAAAMFTTFLLFLRS